MSLVRIVWQDQKGVSATLFALVFVSVMLAVAAAIDFGGATSAKTKLDLAADAAAMTAATTASQMYIAGNSTLTQIQTAASLAGQRRFAAAFGAVANVAGPPVPSIAVTQNTSAFTVALADVATYRPYFASLLGVSAIPMTAASTVTVALTAPYLNVEILLDNSGSMEIGATPNDISTMQELTACALTGAFYYKCPTKSTCSWVHSADLASGDPYHTSVATHLSYDGYTCNGDGYSYTGTLAECPIPATTLDGVSYPAFPDTGKATGPLCPAVVPMPPGGNAANLIHNGFPPRAGPPCGFACHFDTSSQAGTGNDFYALARSTIGTPYQVSLRFDLVKAAVRQVISTMQTNNLPINNLNVGIFWFADIVSRVYPASGEAGGDWQTALVVVGGPASVANGPDTGIQPYVGPNGGNTDFVASMSKLSTMLTASGDGTTAATPRKVLFIVTDGLNDPDSKNITAFNPSACTAFKDMGYKIYVLYTPYYSLTSGFYLNPPPSAAQVVQAPPGSSISIPYNLQQCASSAEGYIEASDSASISTALQTFLKLALTADAHITK